MMASIAEQLAEVRAEIQTAEQRLSDMQIEIIDARVAAATFIADYGQRVWPWQKQLEEVKQKIEKRRGYSDKLSIPGLPDDYVSASEQYRRTFHPMASDKAVDSSVFQAQIGTGGSTDNVSLKKLYRDLALRFHPDLAPDKVTGERWTEFMVKINNAYATGDATALKGLAQALRSETVKSQGNSTETGLALVPDEGELMAAENRLQSLQLALQSAEAELFEIQWGWEFKLKREADKVQQKGRDLLGEMAADLQAELQKAKRELESLTR